MHTTRGSHKVWCECPLRAMITNENMFKTIQRFRKVGQMKCSTSDGEGINIDWRKPIMNNITEGRKYGGHTSI